MKKRNIVILAFLLFLYIAPSFFAMTSYSLPSSAEQNMNKDFSIATEWFDESFHYRKSVYIMPIYGHPAPVNYQINITVPFNAHMQSDFDDIRFTDNDGETLLDYWRESYVASTSAVFWVEVMDELNVPVTIYMYYGNDAVSTTSNGTATFLFYEDWSSQTIDAWTIPAGQADGQTTFSVTDATQGGYVAKIEGNAADSYVIHSDFTYTAPFATMFRANIEEASTGNNARVGTGWAGAYGWAFIQSLSTGESFNVVDDDSNSDAQAMTNAYCDSWIVFQITRDATNAKLYADTVLIETASFAPDAIDNPVFSIQNIDSEDDIYSDWVAVRKFTTTEPILDSFGSEEDNLPPPPPPEWEIVGEAELLFIIPVDYWGLNMGLIFGGLILMLLSACIMAVKVRDRNIKKDTMMILLLLFFVGWGLFIGGGAS